MPTDLHFEAFLALARATDPNNPAPFAWAEFKAEFEDTVPPWSLSATPENSGIPKPELDEILAFARTYYNKAAEKDRTAFCTVSGSRSNRKGREGMIAYIRERWAGWGFNDLITKTMTSNGFDVYTMLDPSGDGLERVSLVSCFVGVTHAFQLFPMEFASGIDVPRNALGARIGGDEAFVNANQMTMPAYKFVNTLLASYWKGMRGKLSRERNALRKARERYDAKRAGAIL